MKAIESSVVPAEIICNLIDARRKTGITEALLLACTNLHKLFVLTPKEVEDLFYEKAQGRQTNNSP